MHYVNISQFGDQFQDRSALQREMRAVQEEMLVIFQFQSGTNNRTCTDEIMPVSVIMQITEFNTYCG